jgi:hypothetical protein
MPWPLAAYGMRGCTCHYSCLVTFTSWDELRSTVSITNTNSAVPRRYSQALVSPPCNPDMLKAPFQMDGSKLSQHRRQVPASPPAGDRYMMTTPDMNPLVLHV